MYKKENRWTLRAFLKNVQRKTNGDCYPESVGFYVDIAPYVTWIKSVL
jgi:hypothetical protein